MKRAIVILGAGVVLVGVLSVICVGAFFWKRIQDRTTDERLARLGATTLVIKSGTASDGVNPGEVPFPTLTVEDADAIRRECPLVSAVAPVLRARKPVAHGNRTWIPLYVCGTTPELLDARLWRGLREGTPFTDQDVKSHAKVCVLGASLVRELFGEESPLDETVRLGGLALRVVGVLEPKGTEISGLDADDILLAPLTTLHDQAQDEADAARADGLDANKADKRNERFPRRADNRPADVPQTDRAGAIDQIVIRAETFDAVKPVVQRVTELLRQRHRLAEGQADDFTVVDHSELIKTAAWQSAFR